MNTNEHLGLVVEADTNPWQRAWEEAQRKVEKLGESVGKAMAKTDSFGWAFGAAGTKGATSFGQLVKQQQDAAKFFDTLGGKVKEQSGLFDDLSKKIVAADLVTKGLGMAFNLAGNYLKGAFDRAKIDPALAGINELRLATEAWTADLESGLDRILEKAARSVQRLTRSFSVMDIEARLRERARANGTSVDQERIRAVDAAFAEGQSLGIYGGTNEATPGRAAALAALWGGATQGKDVAGWGAMGGRGGRDRGPRGSYGNLLGNIGGQIGLRAGIAGNQLSAFWGESNAPSNIFPALGALAGDIGQGFAASGRSFKGGFGAFWGGQRDEFAEFSQAINDNTSAIGGGFSALTSGITAAVDAAIAGSENIGKAFLKASSMALRAIAVESTARAAFETAMGLGASFLAPPAAAAHFAAAGQFAVAAAIAGAGSALLGAAGGGAGAGAGGARTPAGGGYARPANGNASGGGNTTIIQFGHGFALATKTEIVEAIGEAQRAGERSGRGRTSTAGAVAYR